jgi:UDP-glucose 4-epimerase
VTSVLVTGAGGYIGRRITRRLAAEGFGVRALVRTPLAWPDGVEQLVGDLTAPRGLAEEAVAGMDAVIHLAGANEVAMATDPTGASAATLSAAQRIADSGIGRIIYLSTIHVYGAAMAPDAVIREDTPPSPVHPYAQIRLDCEGIFTRSSAAASIFRLTNGVGAPAAPEVQRWSLVANELCREGALYGRLTLRSSGVQWRDFVALTDVESVLLAQVAHGDVGLYNLGSGVSRTVRSLAAMIQDSFESFGCPRPELVAPDAPAESPAAYHVNIDRLSQLGIGPPTPLRAAVDETVSFCLDHRELLG